MEINVAPVICTPRSGPTDITFKYLDMRKFFDFEKIVVPYYFKSGGINNCIDRPELKKKVVKRVV